MKGIKRVIDKNISVENVLFLLKSCMIGAFFLIGLATISLEALGITSVGIGLAWSIIHILRL